MMYEVVLRDLENDMDFVVYQEAIDNADLYKEMDKQYKGCDVVSVQELEPHPLPDYNSFFNEGLGMLATWRSMK